MRKHSNIILKKSYRTYLLTYMIVLIVPLLITIFGYFFSAKAIREETFNYHFNLLKQTRQMYDQVVKTADAGAYVLSDDQTMKSLVTQESWGAKQKLDALKLRNALLSVRGSSIYFEDVLVYFQKDACLVTTGRRYPSKFLYQYTNNLGISEEEFLQKIDQNTLFGYFLIGDQEKGNHRIAFYRHVYDHSIREKLATIILIVPWNNIAEVAENVTLSEQGGILLVNSAEQVIGNSNPMIDIDSLTYGSLQDDSALLNRNFEGNKYIVSYLDSKEWDVKYAIYTPHKEFFEKIIYLQVVIGVEVVLCVLVGSILAVYFARQTFDPIKQMLAMLDNKKEESKDALTYERLESSLKELLNEHTDATKQLAVREGIIREGMLAGLMMGWNQNRERAEFYFQEIQEKWESSDYRVILFQIHNLEQCKLFEGQSEEEKGKTLPLALFAIKNVLEELLLANDKGIVVRVDGMPGCLINISDEWEDIALEGKIQECLKFYREAFEMDVIAAVSGIHSGVDEVSIAYEEAQSAIAHKNFWGSEVAQILLYDKEVLQIEADVNYSFIETQKKFMNCVSVRNYSKAEELLEELLEKSMRKDMRYLAYNQCQASGIIMMLTSVFTEFSDESGNELQNLDIFGRLYRASSIAQLKEETHALFQEIISYYDNKSKGEEPTWIFDVKKYLQENYCDGNINISAIAEKFDMSLSYMGRTFRKFTGESMLDYIHMLRLAKVKDLLDQGESVKDAAEAVGYLDSKAMIRAFKRYEGITPGQYKRQ